MKTIIKIVIVLVVLTACFNAARVALNNFQFEDAVQQALLFDTRAADPEVIEIVMKLAREYSVPLDPDNINIRLVGQDRHVDMKYTETVNLLPGVYSRPWTFEPKAQTRILAGVGR